MADQNLAMMLWKVGDKIRGKEAISFEVLIRACKEERIELTLHTLGLLVKQFGRGEAFVPESVSRFVGGILKPYSPASILDPWSGLGFLAIPLGEILGPEKFDAYCRNAFAGEIWGDLQGASGISLKLGDGLQSMVDSDEKYDAIVCNPPLNLPLTNPYAVQVEGDEVKVKDTYDKCLMLEACKNLTPNGRAVFIATMNFFTSSGGEGKARHTMARLGYRPTAAIELPAGTFAPAHNVATHLVVVERSEKDKLFTLSLIHI